MQIKAVRSHTVDILTANMCRVRTCQNPAVSVTKTDTLPKHCGFLSSCARLCEDITHTAWAGEREGRGYEMQGTEEQSREWLLWTPEDTVPRTGARVRVTSLCPRGPKEKRKTQ